MSIAASVLVRPSRWLLIAVGVLCLAVIAIGAMIGLGVVGDLPLWQRMAVALACYMFALSGFFRTFDRQRIASLDISGTGQIRLRIAASRNAAVPQDEDMLVTLLPGSTLWPRFLLLRLKAEDGRVFVLIILPDSLPAEPMRAVAVACRWVAAHNHRL